MLYSNVRRYRALIGAVIATAAACNAPVENGADAALATVVQAVTGQNDAPVLDATKSPELLTEFSGAPVATQRVGTRVSLLVDSSAPAGQVDNVSDPDSTDGDGPAKTGIAIIAFDSSNGLPYYSLDDGANWIGFPLVSNTSALLLPSTALVYFNLTNTGFTGTMASALTFRAWDQSTGTPGSLATTATNGAATAFSTATDTASLTVVPSIALRGSSPASTTGATSLVFNTPAGVVTNDLMFVSIAFTPFNATVTNPNGWQLIERRNGTNSSFALYWKRAIVGEAATHTWTFGATTAAAGGIAAFSNVITSGQPWSSSLGFSTTSGLVHLAVSQNPQMGNTMLLTWHAFASSATWTPPSGMTEIMDVMSAAATGAAGASFESNMQFLVEAGSTGNKPAVASNDADTGQTFGMALSHTTYAPMLDATPNRVLDPVNEDPGVPTGQVGTPVFYLVDAGSIVRDISDPDNSFKGGIAITATDTANGTLYYSVNDGASWQQVGAVSDASALLLAATSSLTTRLYYLPAQDYSGTVSSAVTFRAWDMGQYFEDARVDTSVNGGTTPFSKSKDTIAVTVNPVNDAPQATNLSAAETYTEDTAMNLMDIVVSDVDSANVTMKLTLSNASAGTLNTATAGTTTSTYTAGTGLWQAVGPIAEVNTLLAGVTFTPASNFNTTFTIATSVSDGVAAAVTGTKTMTGTPVNDGPGATNLSANETYTEDTALDLTNIVVSDIDSTTVTVTLTLSNAAAGSLTTATSGAVTSTYVAGTGVWTATGVIANVNALLAGVMFMPAQDFNANITIATSVSDGVATALTGSKALTGTAVEDPAQATNLSAAETYTEDTALDLANVVVAEPDGTTVTATLTLSNATAGALTTSTSGSVTSSYVAATGIWSASGSVADVNGVLAAVSFTPAANFNGSVSIATSISSGPTTLTGAKAVTGTPVDDAPVAADDAATLAEGATASIDLAANDTDVDDTLDLASILLLTMPAHGTVTIGSGGSVTYAHDDSDTTSDSFSYTIKDAAGTASSAATVALTITAVDDADADADGVLDNADNCLDVANADQADADGDTIGDACDASMPSDDTGCGCQSSGSPTAAWPLVLVVVALGRRRRATCSSGRTRRPNR